MVKRIALKTAEIATACVLVAMMFTGMDAVTIYLASRDHK
jgi:hypothetical protein